MSSRVPRGKAKTTPLLLVLLLVACGVVFCFPSFSFAGSPYHAGDVVRDSNTGLYYELDNVPPVTGPTSIIIPSFALPPWASATCENYIFYLGGFNDIIIYEDGVLEGLNNCSFSYHLQQSVTPTVAPPDNTTIYNLIFLASIVLAFGLGAIKGGQP